MNSDLMDRHINSRLDELIDAHGINEDLLLAKLLAPDFHSRRSTTESSFPPERPGRSRRALVLLVAAALMLLCSGAAIAASGANLGSVLDIFTRDSPPPSKGANEHVENLSKAIDEMPAEFGDIGSMDPKSKRVAINDPFGDFQVEIVLSRTTAENICVSTSYSIAPAAPGGGGGCFPTVADATSFQSGYHGRDVVYGLLPDDATAVRVQTSDGRVTDALAKNNAYFWAAPDRATRFKDLEIVRVGAES